MLLVIASPGSRTSKVHFQMKFSSRDVVYVMGNRQDHRSQRIQAMATPVRYVDNPSLFKFRVQELSLSDHTMKTVQQCKAGLIVVCGVNPSIVQGLFDLVFTRIFVQCEGSAVTLKCALLDHLRIQTIMMMFVGDCAGDSRLLNAFVGLRFCEES